MTKGDESIMLKLYRSVETFLDALRDQREQGNMNPPVRWSKSNEVGPLEGVELGTGDTYALKLTTIRKHFRVSEFEPFASAMLRYERAVEKALAISEPLKKGCKVESTKAYSSNATHHGVVVRVTPTIVRIQHDDNCCVLGRVSEHCVGREDPTRFWRHIRRTSWDHLLEEMGED